MFESKSSSAMGRKNLDNLVLSKFISPIWIIRNNTFIFCFVKGIVFLYFTTVKKQVHITDNNK